MLCLLAFATAIYGAAPGRFETYEVTDVAPDESFLEMMDALNDRLILGGGDAVGL